MLARLKKFRMEFIDIINVINRILSKKNFDKMLTTW